MTLALFLSTVGCAGAPTGHTPDTDRDTDSGTHAADGTTAEPLPYPDIEITDEFVNAADEGIVGDGSDCTSALRKLLTVKKKVFLPAGKYLVTASIPLTDDTSLIGEEGTEIVTEGGYDLFLIRGARQSGGKTAVRRQNITVASIAFSAPEPQRQYVVNAKSVEHLVLDRLTVKNMGCIVTETVYAVNAFDGTPDPCTTAGMTSDDCLNSDISITRCKIDCGDATESGATGVYLMFLKNFRVLGCEVSNAWQGIQFWGGDSDYERGGKAENDKRAKNGLIAECTSFDIGGGGIWGSMGQNITVTRCSTGRCGDVGVDFEGCADATATDCKAYDCRNGNYSTFQYCTGKILFFNCESYLGEGYNQHFFNSNSTLTPHEQDITFDHCLFESTELAAVNCQSAMAKFTFTNNTCKNTVVNTTGLNIQQIVIEDNEFTMHVPLTEERAQVIYATANASKLTEGKVLSVCRNRISSDIAQTYSGIVLYHDTVKCTATAEVIGNTVSDDFAIGIELRANKRTAIPLEMTCADNTAGSLTVWEKIAPAFSGNKKSDGSELTAEDIR